MNVKQIFRWTVALSIATTFILTVPARAGKPKRTGALYVAAPGINVYPPGSHGNCLPSALIEGSNTGVLDATDIAVDSIGNIYLTNDYSPAGTVTVYGPGSDGNVFPIETYIIDDYPVGVAVDSSGYVYVTLPAYNAITIYAPNTGNGNGYAVPSDLIVGRNTGLVGPLGIALDSSGKIYVVNLISGGHLGGVSVFAALPDLPIAPATGDIDLPPGARKRGTGATPQMITTDHNVEPLATIAGPHTGLHYPTGVAVDSKGYIYVTDSDLGTKPEPRIWIYAPGSNGDVEPYAKISGNRTGLNGPFFGIAVDAAGQIYAGNSSKKGKPWIDIYAPGRFGNVAPIAKITGWRTGLITSAGIAVGPP